MEKINTNLSVVIFDNNLASVLQLEQLIRNLRIAKIVGVYTNLTRFLNEFPTLKYDLLLLGIENIGMRGKQLVKMLGRKPCIILTYGVEWREAILCHPIDTLIKPINDRLLTNALAKSMRLMNFELNDEFMEFNTERGEGKCLLRPKDFVFVEKDINEPRNKIATMRNGEKHFLMNYTIPEIQEKVPHLLRPNRTQLVCPEIITYHNYEHIYIKFPINGSQPIKLKKGRYFASQFNIRLSKPLLNAK